MKKETPKKIEKVELINKDMVLDLPRIGMRITSENLTVARYEKLISISSDFSKYFNVKLKQNEKSIELDSKK